jgi:hypothetical protein
MLIWAWGKVFQLSEQLICGWWEIPHCQSRQVGHGEGKVRNPDPAHKADSFRRRCSLTLGCGIVYIQSVEGMLVARMIDLQLVGDSAIVKVGIFIL